MSELGASEQKLYMSDLRAAIKDGSIGTDKVFNNFALRLFRLQSHHGTIGHLWRRPMAYEPKDWQEIPLLPQISFKYEDLRPNFAKEPERIFQTSGTTTSKRGKHSIFDMEWYRFISVTGMRCALYPDTGGPALSILALLPSDEESPDSSLSTMMGFAMKDQVGGEHCWGIRDGELRVEDCLDWLLHHEAAGVPVLVVGTAFSWVHLLDAMVAQGRRFQMPEGSRLMETGGFKGRSRELAPETLHRLMKDHLGIGSPRIINEYGMTELMSQLYTQAGQKLEDRIWFCPPWMRVRIIDPRTKRNAAAGESGAIAFIDLANVTSSVSLQTQDVGMLSADGGLILRGRARTATPRGCSLPMEEGLPRVQTALDSVPPALKRTNMFMRDSKPAIQALGKRSFYTLCDDICSILSTMENRLNEAGAAPLGAMAQELGVSDLMFAQGFRTGIRFWSREAFLDVVRQELGKRETHAVEHGDAQHVLIIAASTVPSAMAFEIFRAWLAGKSAIVRVPESLTTFANWFHSMAGQVAPYLAECLSLVTWDSESIGYISYLGTDISTVVVSGSDETVAAIEEEIAEGVQLIPYGTRQSLSLMSRETLESEDLWPAIQRGLAQDVLLWGQRGCLSPTCLFLEADWLLHRTQIIGFLTGLDEAIEDFAKRFERLPLSLDVAVSWMEHEARWRFKRLKYEEQIEFENLALEPWENEEIPVVQGGRIVVFVVESLNTVYKAKWTVPLSTVVVHSKDMGSRELLAFSRERGASRVVPPGEAQAPRVDWKHDGYGVLEVLK